MDVLCLSDVNFQVCFELLVYKAHMYVITMGFTSKI